MPEETRADGEQLGGGRRRAKGTTYNVSDFIKMTEKQIKAEKIEEEETKATGEERSEKSIGARTGVSDLVPMLNLTDEDDVTVTIALDSEDEVQGTRKDEEPQLENTRASGHKETEKMQAVGEKEKKQLPESDPTEVPCCLLYTSPSPRD